MSSAAAAPPFRKMGTGRDKRTDGIELMTRERIRTLRLKRRWMDARREGGSKEGRKEGREGERERGCSTAENVLSLRQTRLNKLL